MANEAAVKIISDKFASVINWFYDSNSISNVVEFYNRLEKTFLTYRSTINSDAAIAANIISFITGKITDKQKTSQEINGLVLELGKYNVPRFIQSLFFVDHLINSKTPVVINMEQLKEVFFYVSTKQSIHDNVEVFTIHAEFVLHKAFKALLPSELNKVEDYFKKEKFNLPTKILFTKAMASFNTDNTPKETAIKDTIAVKPKTVIKKKSTPVTDKNKDPEEGVKKQDCKTEEPQTTTLQATNQNQVKIISTEQSQMLNKDCDAKDDAVTKAISILIKYYEGMAETRPDSAAIANNNDLMTSLDISFKQSDEVRDIIRLAFGKYIEYTVFSVMFQDVQIYLEEQKKHTEPQALAKRIDTLESNVNKMLSILEQLASK